MSAITPKVFYCGAIMRQFKIISRLPPGGELSRECRPKVRKLMSYWRITLALATVVSLLVFLAQRANAAVISDIMDISSTPGVLVTDLITGAPAHKTIDDSPPGSPNDEPLHSVFFVVANPSAGRAFDFTRVALLEDDKTVSDLIFTTYFPGTNRFGIEFESDANESLGGPGLTKPPPGPDTAFIDEFMGDSFHQPVRGFLDIPDLMFKTNGVPQNVGLIVSVRSDTERPSGLPEPASLLLLAAGLVSLLVSRAHVGLPQRCQTFISLRRGAVGRTA